MTDQERNQTRKVIDASRKVARLKRELAEAERVFALEIQRLERVIKRTFKAQAANGEGLH